MRSTKGPNFINNKSLRAHLLLGFSCNLGTSKNPRRQTWLPPLCAACCWHQSQSVEGYPGFVFLPMDGDLPDQSQLQVTYPGTQKEPDWEPGWELSVKDGLLFVWVEQSLSCYPRCVLPTPPPPVAAQINASDSLLQSNSNFVFSIEEDRQVGSGILCTQYYSYYLFSHSFLSMSYSAQKVSLSL